MSCAVANEACTRTIRATHGRPEANRRRPIRIAGAVLGVMLCAWSGVSRAQQMLSGLTDAQCASHGGHIITYTNTAGQGPNRGDCLIAPSNTFRGSGPGSGIRTMPMPMPMPNMGGFAPSGPAVDMSGTVRNARNQSSGMSMDFPEPDPPAAAPSTPPAAPPIASGPNQTEPDCIPYLRRQREVALQNARQCQVNEDLLTSMDLWLARGYEQGIADPLPADKARCGGSLDGVYERPDPNIPSSSISAMNQNMADRACGRVYVCASAAYTVALNQARQGASCEVAMKSGLNRYPIPH